MDNFAHTLLGAAMAKSALGRRSRLAAVSLVVGANLPDVDCVAQLFGGRAAYLVHHRGVTHSLLGIAIGTLLLGAAVRWIERRGDAPSRVRLGGAGVGESESRLGVAAATSGLPWSAHLVPAFAGLSSHLALDALNNYGVRPWLPFSSARWYGDLVFIVDPWLWLLFGGAALLAGPRSRRGGAVWLALGVGVTSLVEWHARTPVAVKWWWPIALALLAVLRISGVGRASPRRVLAIGGALVVLYLGGLEVSASLARSRAVAPPLAPSFVASTPHSSRAIETPVQPWRYAMRAPVIGDPLAWRLFFATDQWVAVELVDVEGRARETEFVGPRRLDDPDVRAVAATSEYESWQYFARLPWAWIDDQTSPRRVVVTDARYDWVEDDLWCSLAVALPPR